MNCKKCTDGPFIPTRELGPHNVSVLPVWVPTLQLNTKCTHILPLLLEEDVCLCEVSQSMLCLCFMQVRAVCQSAQPENSGLWWRRDRESSII